MMALTLVLYMLQEPFLLKKLLTVQFMPFFQYSQKTFRFRIFLINSEFIFRLPLFTWLPRLVSVSSKPVRYSLDIKLKSATHLYIFFVYMHTLKGICPIGIHILIKVLPSFDFYSEKPCLRRECQQISSFLL